MPDYIDVDQMRERLLQQREELQERFNADRSETIAHGTIDPGDTADMASHDENISMLGRLNDAEFRQLRAIDGALARIANGSYGECISCGEEIDPARLRALPTATRCINCMEEESQVRPGPGAAL